MTTDTSTPTTGTELNQATFIIRQAYIETAQTKLAELCKKARKVGVSEPMMEIGEAFQESKWEDGIEFVVNYVPVTIKWEPIVLPGGWEFGASIEVHDCGNMLKGPLSDSLPTSYRTQSKLTCEHCKTVRNRKKYYVLINENDETIVVGSTCIREFLGVSATAALNYLEMIDGYVRMTEGDWESEGGYIPLEAGLMTVAAMTFACVRSFGFVSKKMLAEDWSKGCTTKDDVSNQLWNKKIKPEDRVKITDEDKAKAETVLQVWQKEVEELDANKADEWQWRRAILTQDGYVSSKNLGIAVASIYMTDRKLREDEERKATQAGSEHFGTEKKRETFELTVTKTTLLDGLYGYKTIINGVRSGSGDRWVWFASGDVQEEWKEGETYTVKATVKEHATHERYGIQTVLNRVAKV